MQGGVQGGSQGCASSTWMGSGALTERRGWVWSCGREGTSSSSWAEMWRALLLPPWLPGVLSELHRWCWHQVRTGEAEVQRGGEPPV